MFTNKIKSLSNLPYVAYSIIAITFFRIVYSLVFMNPMSGPDSPTYLQVLSLYNQSGWLSKSEMVPFWQPGYPWFLHYLSNFLFHFNLELLMVLQTILYGFGVFAFYVFMRNIHVQVARISTILLLINPALFVASTELMYETPQISFFFISQYSLFALLRGNLEFRRKLLLEACFCISVFFAITMQPKILLAYLSLCFFLPKVSQTNWNYAYVFRCFMSITLPFVVLQFRNLYTGFGWGISSNFRTHILTGNQQVIPYDSNCILTSQKDSLNEILCLISERFSDKALGVEVTLHNLFDFLAPYIGPLGYGGVNGTGTWFHGLDFRRLIPATLAANDLYIGFDRILSHLWMLSMIFLILCGFIFSFRENSLLPLGKYLFTSFIATLLPTLIGVGDARYRLVAMPFYLPLIAIALLNIKQRLIHKKRRKIM